MNDDSKNSILKILEAIDYADDKEAFVKEFTELVHIQAMDRLIILLPQYQQDSLKSQLAAAGEDLVKIGDVLKIYFSQEQMQNSLEKVSEEAVREWMKAINPALSDQQKENLSKLSEEFNSTPPPSQTP